MHICTSISVQTHTHVHSWAQQYSQADESLGDFSAGTDCLSYSELTNCSIRCEARLSRVTLYFPKASMQCWVKIFKSKWSCMIQSHVILLNYSWGMNILEKMRSKKKKKKHSTDILIQFVSFLISWHKPACKCKKSTTSYLFLVPHHSIFYFGSHLHFPSPGLGHLRLRTHSKRERERAVWVTE